MVNRERMGDLLETRMVSLSLSSRRPGYCDRAPRPRIRDPFREDAGGERLEQSRVNVTQTLLNCHKYSGTVNMFSDLVMHDQPGYDPKKK